MPMMKAPYTFQHISTSGHSVEFEANEPIWVAQCEQLVTECLAKGAMLIDGEAPAVAAAPEEKSDNEPDAEEEFRVALDAALMKILVRNDPTDLKSDLTPKVTKVVAEMSPDLRRPTATEVSEAYSKLQENIDLSE